MEPTQDQRVGAIILQFAVPDQPAATIMNLAIEVDRLTRAECKWIYHTAILHGNIREAVDRINEVHPNWDVVHIEHGVGPYTHIVYKRPVE